MYDEKKMKPRKAIPSRIAECRSLSKTKSTIACLQDPSVALEKAVQILG